MRWSERRALNRAVTWAERGNGLTEKTFPTRAQRGGGSGAGAPVSGVYSPDTNRSRLRGTAKARLTRQSLWVSREQKKIPVTVREARLGIELLPLLYQEHITSPALVHRSPAGFHLSLDINVQKFPAHPESLNT